MADAGDWEELDAGEVWPGGVSSCFVVDGEVDLVGGDDLALVGEHGAEGFQLAADRAVVVGGVGAVGRVEVEQVDDDFVRSMCRRNA